MNLTMEIVGFAFLWAAIPCLLLAVIFGPLAIAARVSPRLDRVQRRAAEREREDAMLAVLADPALWESMERRAEQ